MKKIVSFLILAILFSCNKENSPDFVQSTGKMTSVERSLMPFNDIIIEGSIDVILMQDTINKVVINGGKNLLSDIKTEVSDNLLLIKNENRFNWVRSLKKELNATVHFKELNHLENQGPGKLSCYKPLQSKKLVIDVRNVGGDINLDLNCDSFQLALHTSPSNVVLKGSANYHYSFLTGNCWVNATELSTKHTFINNSGTGDAIVKADSLLEASIHSYGNIQYYGTPVIITHITGSGKLIKK